MQAFIKLVLTFGCATILFSGVARAQSGGAAFSGDVQEPDFPCAIVLCFANPKGPLGEEKCRPPVNWLISNFIKKFRPWPKCVFGDKDNTQVDYFAQPHVECPAGFTAEQVNPEGGGTPVLTGVCLKPLKTCTPFQASAPDSACYVYRQFNDFGTAFDSYYEYVIPSSGVTGYSMQLYNGAGLNKTHYFNLNGTGATNTGVSIIYRNSNANGNPYGN